jgi:hypothetical protein
MATRKGIYNELQRTKARFLNGHTPLEALIETLAGSSRYGMPLLSIVRGTSTNHSFNAGFVFMTEETETHYSWDFGQLRSILNSPAVFITDRELSLMNSLKLVFL